MLEKIFAVTYLAIAYLDTRYNFVRVNRAFAEVYTADARNVDRVNYFDNVTDPKMRSFFEKVVTTGLPCTAHEYPFAFSNRSPDDMSFWDLTIQPMKDPAGNIEGILLCMADVTERKRAEEQLLEYQRQLRSMATRLSMTEEQERRKIAADLHDSIGQSLALTQIKIEQARAFLGASPCSNILDEIWKLTNHALEDTQSLISELSPPVLHELGFDAALDWLTEKISQEHNLPCRVINRRELPQDIDRSVYLVLFRAVRELLINAVKHARARNLQIDIEGSADTFLISVRDDGIGYNPTPVNTVPQSGGFGLFNIREQMDQLGGRLDITNNEEKGACFTLVLPLHHSADRTGS